MKVNTAIKAVCDKDSPNTPCTSDMNLPSVLMLHGSLTGCWVEILGAVKVIGQGQMPFLT